LYARKKPKHVIHHSVRGSQYLSIRYTERLQAAHMTASVGTTGDYSYDNALAETVNGLYKTEVIHHQKPWRRMVDVELAVNGHLKVHHYGHLKVHHFKSGF